MYRLVTEDTIEEKVVERAQQKLKLDAMVVQRGMLQGEKKLEKDEMLAAIRWECGQRRILCYFAIEMRKRARSVSRKYILPKRWRSTPCACPFYSPERLEYLPLKA